MTNQQRIKQLEKQKAKLLDDKHVSSIPAEDWMRSMDALASVLSVTRAELEKELQRLNLSMNR